MINNKVITNTGKTNSKVIITKNKTNYIKEPEQLQGNE